MYTTSPSSPPLTPLAAVPPPLFTVGSALRWLGHECSGHPCYDEIDDVVASVWFVRRNQRFRASPPETLVLLHHVGTTSDRAHLRRVVDGVRSCTRVDGISVHDLRDRAKASS